MAHWCPPDEANPISDDQRKILKETTGFEGYTAYLEDYSKKHSGCEPLLKAWRMSDEKSREDKLRRIYYCDILDLIKDENSSISFNLCCSTASNTELFTALSEPQTGIYGRVMIWRAPKSRINHADFLEDLGLVLKIGPSFVESLYTRSDHYILGSAHIPVFAASHVMVGDSFATMTHCCISEKSSAVPIVFIADTTDPVIDPGSVDPVFQQHPGHTWPPAIYKYGEMIKSIIERNSRFSEFADALIMPALLAAIHMRAVHLRVACSYTLPGRLNRPNDDSLEHMSEERNALRRRIEDFEGLLQDAMTGFSLLYGDGWSVNYGLESTVEYFKQTINRVRRYEADIQDQCQMQIGRLSLAEFQKSIELSNSQIEEGKRVKIFTVLAFVYVPLNLATSIFGMNIQQLNDSGQSIQTCLVTAVVVLLLTGGSWLCIDQVNEYRRWSRRYRPHVLPRPTYNIVVRVHMLVWLISNGHWAWARKTKAWWYILANSRADRLTGFGSRLSVKDWFIDDSDRDLSAGDYVSRYMCSGHASLAFTLRSGEHNEG